MGQKLTHFIFESEAIKCRVSMCNDTMYAGCTWVRKYGGFKLGNLHIHITYIKRHPCMKKMYFGLRFSFDTIQSVDLYKAFSLLMYLCFTKKNDIDK